MSQTNANLALLGQPAGSPWAETALPPRQPVVRSRANITSACLACKRRKRKCEGGHPCPHCAAVKVECLYNEEMDKRRKVFGDKVRAGMELERHLLSMLLAAMRSEHVHDVVNIVRTYTSLEVIATQLEDLGGQTGAAMGTARHADARLADPGRSTSLSVHDACATAASNSRGSYVASTRSARVLNIDQLLGPASLE